MQKSASSTVPPVRHLIGFCGIRNGSIDLSDLITVDPPSRVNIAALFPPEGLSQVFPYGHVPVEARIDRLGRIIDVRMTLPKEDRE